MEADRTVVNMLTGEAESATEGPQCQLKIPDVPALDHGFTGFPAGAETAEAAPEACRIGRKLMLETPWTWSYREGFL